MHIDVVCIHAPIKCDVRIGLFAQLCLSIWIKQSWYGNSRQNKNTFIHNSSISDKLGCIACTQYLFVQTKGLYRDSAADRRIKEINRYWAKENSTRTTIDAANLFIKRISKHSSLPCEAYSIQYNTIYAEANKKISWAWGIVRSVNIETTYL